MSLSKFLSERKNLDEVVIKLQNMPEADKIKKFECRTKRCAKSVTQIWKFTISSLASSGVLLSVVVFGMDLSKVKGFVVKKLMCDLFITDQIRILEKLDVWDV